MDHQKDIQILKKERSDVLSHLDANYKTLEDEVYNTKMQRVEAIDAQILKAETIEKHQSKNMVNPMAQTTDGRKSLESFDFSRFLRNAVNKNAQEGVEAEVITEQKAFMKNAGLEASGMSLPFEVFNAHTAGAANNGAELVETIKTGKFIDALQPYSVLTPLGANILTGLSGNLEIGAITNPVNPGVKTETADADDYTATIVSRSLNPTRGAVETTFSQTLLANTSYNVQQILSRHLLSGVTRRAESHAMAEVIASAGTTVAIGTNGGALTYAKSVELLNSLSAANSSGLNNAFVTNSKVRSAGMQIALDTGSGRFLWEHTTPNLFLGNRALVTNYAPATLSKGSADGTLSALVYGDFSSLTVGFWGGLNIVLDEITLATTGQIRLIVNFFHDSVVEVPENFGVIKDIIA